MLPRTLVSYYGIGFFRILKCNEGYESVGIVFSACSFTISWRGTVSLLSEVLPRKVDGGRDEGEGEGKGRMREGKGVPTLVSSS